MSKPVFIPTTFATGNGGPTPVSLLDSNFTAVAAAVNDLGTYTNYVTDTGSANSYVVSYPTGITVSLVNGLTIAFRALNSNTAGSTLNVQNLGPVVILRPDGTPAQPGDIPGGRVITVVYDQLANAFYMTSLGAIPVGSAGSVTYQAPYAGSVPSTVQNAIQYLGASVKDFGALGNGVANDAPKLVTANASGAPALFFPVGTYVVNSSVTFTLPVIFQAGAVLSLPTGVTVTFNNAFTAGVQQCFSLTGTASVVFSPSFNRIGYPEWWGATVNNVLFDNLPAINACIVALPITLLQQADYYVSGPIQITTPHRRLEGTVSFINNYGAGSGSRVIVTSATANSCFIGLASNPGSINNFLRNTAVKYVQFRRSTAPTPPTAGNEINGPAGVFIQYTLYCDLEYVSCEENSLGFVMSGTVRTNLKNCTAFRSLAGTTPTNDIFWGFFQNGSASIGAAGGNASTYYFWCSATVGGSPTLTNPIGYLLNGAPVDTFMVEIETSALATGLFISGSGGVATDQDVHVIGGTFDQFTTAGMVFSSLGANAAISAVDCYAAPGSAATSSSYGMSVVSSSGMISLTNNQIDCQSGPSCGGLHIASSAGITTAGNMYNGSKQPIILQTSGNLSIADIVNNGSAVAGTQAAIYLDTCSRTVIDTLVKGAAGAFPQGIWCNGTTVVSTECRMSKVDAGCITGGSGNKLVYNGGQITAAGAFGANLAQGIMT